MAQAAVDISVLLKMVDGLSGPAARAVDSLNKIGRAIEGVHAASSKSHEWMERLGAAHEKLAERAERSAERMKAAQGKAIAGAVALFGLASPLQRVADRETGLINIQQINEWSEKFEKATGKAAYRKLDDGSYELATEGAKKLVAVTQEMNAEFNKLSRETNQSGDSIMKIMNVLAGKLGQRLDTPDFLKIARDTAFAATATGVEVDKLSEMATTFYQHFGIRPESTQRAFDIAIKAGQMGGFELPAMGRYYPMLSAQWRQTMNPFFEEQLKGLTGGARDKKEEALGLREVANLSSWLQIAVLGSGDEEGAATNLKYLIQKSALQQTAMHMRDYIDPRKLDLSALGINAANYAMPVNAKAGVVSKRLMLGMPVPEGEQGGETQGLNWWKFADDMKKQRGWDPVRTQMQVALAIEKMTGTSSSLNAIWNDHMAMQALSPILIQYKKWQIETGNAEAKLQDFIDTAYGAEGTTQKNVADRKPTLNYAFRDFKNTWDALVNSLYTIGAKPAATKMFGFLADAGWGILDQMAAHRGAFQTIAQAIFAIGAGVAGLAVARYLFAGLGFAMAHAGMAGISFLRIIPGMGAVLGALAGPLGMLMKLGLLGGLGVGGFLAWQHWDKLKASAQPALEYLNAALGNVLPASMGRLHLNLEPVTAFFARLSELFPSLSAGAGQFADKIKAMIPSMESLKQIGTDLYQGLKWLFTGEGDKGGFAKAGAGIGALDAVKGMGEHLEKYKSALLMGGDDGFMTRLWTAIKAWGATGAAAFGGLGLFAVGEHGAEGWLLMLMALRSVMFVAGLAIGAFQLLASVVGLVLQPLLMAIGLDVALMHLGRTLIPLGGLIAATFYALGWDGVKALWRGFGDGFSSGVGEGVANFQASMSHLGEALFGKGAEGDELAKRIQTLTTKAFSAGLWVGEKAAWVLDLFSGAINRLANALQLLEATSPGSVGKILDIASNVGGALIGIGAVMAFGHALRWLAKGMLGLTGLPTIWKMLFCATAATGEGAAAVAAVGVGGRIAAAWRAAAGMGMIGQLGAGFAAIFAGGVIGRLVRGIALVSRLGVALTLLAFTPGGMVVAGLLAIVAAIGLVIYNWDAMQARFGAGQQAVADEARKRLYGGDSSKDPSSYFYNPSAGVGSYSGGNPDAYDAATNAITDVGKETAKKLGDAGNSLVDELQAIARAMGSVAAKFASLGIPTGDPTPANGALSDYVP